MKKSPGKFKVGDRVRVRDEKTDRWKEGKVTEVSSNGEAQVEPDGWGKSYSWEEIELEGIIEGVGIKNPV